MLIIILIVGAHAVRNIFKQYKGSGDLEIEILKCNLVYFWFSNGLLISELPPAETG